VSRFMSGPQVACALFATFSVILGCESPNTNPARDAQATNAVAVAEAFLLAIGRADTAALRLHSVSATRLVALSDEPNAEPQVTSLEAFLAQIQGDSGRYLERMWAPQAHVDGRLATVWTEYDFYRDEAFSHCGIDSFDLVRMGRSWKVLSVVYTIHPEDCANSPLGPAFP